MSGILSLYFQQILKRFWIKYGSKFSSLPDLVLSSTFLYLVQGQPTISSRLTHHNRKKLFSVIINPINIINLQLVTIFTQTCSLLTSIVTTGSIFCRYPFLFFLCYLAFYYYSTTIIRDGFPSANANSVILIRLFLSGTFILPILDFGLRY